MYNYRREYINVEPAVFRPQDQIDGLEGLVVETEVEIIPKHPDPFANGNLNQALPFAYL